jgi:hypothetical protein
MAVLLGAPSAVDAQPKERAVLKGHTREVTSVVFSPDSKLLASGSWDTALKLWDAAAGQELATLQGHPTDTHPLTFSADGKTLISCSSDGTIKHWEVETRKERSSRKWDLEGHMWLVRLSPDGKVDHTPGNADGQATGLLQLGCVRPAGVSICAHLSEAWWKREAESPFPPLPTNRRNTDNCIPARWPVKQQPPRLQAVAHFAAPHNRVIAAPIASPIR